jgi:hypothetical protein
MKAKATAFMPRENVRKTWQRNDIQTLRGSVGLSGGAVSWTQIRPKTTPELKSTLKGESPLKMLFSPGSG